MICNLSEFVVQNSHEALEYIGMGEGTFYYILTECMSTWFTKNLVISLCVYV